MQAVDRRGGGIDARVLGVHVIDRRRQRARRGQRIGAHPEQMARIEVRADRRTDRLAQPEQRLHVVDVLLAVQFQAQLAPRRPLRLRHQALPIGDQHLVPLPGQHARGLRRPGRGDPVGIGIARTAGAAGHQHHAFHAQQSGQADRLRGHLLMARAELAGMQRIAGAVQRAERQPVVAATAPGNRRARPRCPAWHRGSDAARWTSCRSRNSSISMPSSAAVGSSLVE